MRFFSVPFSTYEAKGISSTFSVRNHAQYASEWWSGSIKPKRRLVSFLILSGETFELLWDVLITSMFSSECRVESQIAFHNCTERGNECLKWSSKNNSNNCYGMEYISARLGFVISSFFLIERLSQIGTDRKLSNWKEWSSEWKSHETFFKFAHFHITVFRSSFHAWEHDGLKSWLMIQFGCSTFHFSAERNIEQKPWLYYSRL